MVWIWWDFIFSIKNWKLLISWVDYLSGEKLSYKCYFKKVRTISHALNITIHLSPLQKPPLCWRCEISFQPRQKKKMCFYNDNCRIHWLTTQKSTQSNHFFSSLTMKSTKVQDWFQVPNWDLAWQKGSQFTRWVVVSIWWRLRKLINFSKSILKYCESRSLWFPNCNNSKTILLGSYTTFTWNQFTIVTSSNTNMYIL